MANRRRNYAKRQVVLTPRTEKMPVDQDWPSVWPTARVFHPASVPLPLHQGFVDKGKRAPPNKFGNAELMKIPNFLHLTPPAIERHCEALKSIISFIYFIIHFNRDYPPLEFCNPWPKELETEEQMKKHFPVEFTSSDYCHSSPTIRDPRARIVTMQVTFHSLIILLSHCKCHMLNHLRSNWILCR
jgi:small subunit ribosomal protein S35